MCVRVNGFKKESTNNEKKILVKKPKNKKAEHAHENMKQQKNKQTKSVRVCVCVRVKMNVTNGITLSVAKLQI